MSKHDMQMANELAVSEEELESCLLKIAAQLDRMIKKIEKIGNMDQLESKIDRIEETVRDIRMEQYHFPSHAPSNTHLRRIFNLQDPYDHCGNRIEPLSQD